MIICRNDLDTYPPLERGGGPRLAKEPRWWGSSFAENKLYCYKDEFVVIVRYYPSVIGAVTNTKLKVYSAPMPPPLARGDMCRELSSKLTKLRFV